MKIVFYYTLLSPPSRAVLLTGNALGIQFDLKNVDLIKGEHLSEEFKKVNDFTNKEPQNGIYIPMKCEN